ncbi:ABC transporter permease [Flavobacterium aciduliphilum]|uniref:3-hydroxymyristoyl/3-hydroxydecanoyl-(Acyl carrier protein) dehydratase n=1 Tax=Flavobacterium aciduliphilum TaxID=1101402 RepID=A0A328YHR0_9FLAO|nr:ABC transporter permease [Flavobacterium aciduliphilum]RAR71522.1 3-hydroxymyristoyl/3-hydroxydecanoyl-(acyl carrier protein) dehydratase [Flavobacterium aciduliphilum]
MQHNTNTISIQDYLPHRAPMLMVDLILELSHQEVKTILDIKKDNVFVENDVFAEIGLVENAAQTCSAIVGQSFFLDDNQEIKQDIKVIGFISGIKKVKVYDLAKVGDVIQTNSVLVSRFDNDSYSICTMSTETYVEDKLIFEAEMNLFIQEN